MCLCGGLEIAAVAAAGVYVMAKRKKVATLTMPTLAEMVGRQYYAFAVACFVLAVLILRAGIDDSLPAVVDYRSGPIFDPPEVTTPPPYKVTAYCSCPICCGKYADGITYSGSVAIQGRTAAADIGVWDIGSCLSIPTVGRRIVEDIGGAIKGRRIDVYFDSHERALEFGVQWLPVKEC